VLFLDASAPTIFVTRTLLACSLEVTHLSRGNAKWFSYKYGRC